MKRIWLVVCLLALVGVPAGASSFGAGIAYWDTEDAGDDNGLGIKLSIDVGSKWNVDLRAAWFDGHGLTQGPRVLGIEATAVDLGLSYDFQTGGKVTPYIGGGLNYSLYDADSFNFVVDQREEARAKDEPGYYVVLGLEIPVKNAIAFYGEVMYRQSKPTVKGDGLASFGAIPVDFAGVGASVGIAYTW